jgi:hypothetical protein
MSLSSVKPKMAGSSLSVMTYKLTDSARHSSTLAAISPEMLFHVSPGRYHVVIDLPVRGLIGGFWMSKLYLVGPLCVSSFPVRWPSSSWTIIWSFQAWWACFIYDSASDESMKGRISDSNRGLSQFTIMIFLKPTVYRISLYYCTDQLSCVAASFLLYWHLASWYRGI